jgi:outer membrane protein assembly factor BamB
MLPLGLLVWLRRRRIEFPDRWSAAKHVVWKADLPGRGWSSPVVWGGRVFLTTVVNRGESEPPKKGLYLGGDRPRPPAGVHAWWVYGLDAGSGTVRWKEKVHEGPPASAIHIKNSYDAKTGRAFFERERIPDGGGFTASPWAANGKLYCLNEDGVTFVLRAGERFELLHANRLADDDMGMAPPPSPAIRS